MVNKNKRAEIRQPSNKRIIFFRQSILEWFHQNRRSFPWRNKSASNYVLILAEIFLRRTRAAMVARFLPGFVRLYPSWKSISLTNKDILAQHLRPLGLAPTRSKTLITLSKELTKIRGRFPSSREELERLPGVGHYTASGILLFCFRQPEPLLDVGMARVIERFFGPRKLADIRFDPYLQQLSRSIVNTSSSTQINWAILDFAALVCKKENPKCDSCPLAKLCKSRPRQVERCKTLI